MTAKPPARAATSGPLLIRKSHGIKALSAGEETVLRHMFAGCEQAMIEAELGRGFSGSRVFRIRLTEKGGNAHLPAVVKIGPRELIDKERRAYKTWVEHSLPRASRLEVVANLPADTALGGLHYSLAGDGIFRVQSLADYYREDNIDNLCWLLENRLFKILKGWWSNHHRDPTFQMQTDYDAWLPVNLRLKPIETGGVEGPVIRLEAGHLPPPPIQAGQQVELKGFTITEVNPAKGEVTLDLAQPPEERAMASYRVRLIEAPEAAAYRVNQVIDSLYGRVTATRHDLLLELAGQALGETVDLSTERLALPTAKTTSPTCLRTSSPPPSLPNPLLGYEELLWTVLTVYTAPVHGDLNLENIMVDPKTRDVEFIDFARSHRGHAVSDLLRLEVETVVKLIPPVLSQAGLPPETIYRLYEQLDQTHRAPGWAGRPELPHPDLAKPFRMLQTIRTMARECLFDRDDWGEYYRGLSLYLLGTLKFKSLSRISKQIAFWGAAAAQGLLETASPPPGKERPGLVPSSIIVGPAPVIEPPYGTMPLDSKLYIERAADDLCRRQLGQEYAVTLFIQAPWQTGKSSLMGRAIAQARQQYHKQFVFIDFQAIPVKHFEDEDEFLKALCVTIGQALDIPPAIDRYWSGLQTSIVKCSRYLADHILPQLDAPLILAMDEVQRMLTSPFRADFFGMLRTWHNQRFFNEHLARLSLLLSSSTEPYLLIDNPYQSPFNVAERIFLEDFSRPEVEELNRRHGLLLQPDQLDQLMELLGGHPFLTRLALYRLAMGETGLESLLARATEDRGPFGDHLRHYQGLVLAHPRVKQALAGLLGHQAEAEEPIFYRLSEAGLIKRVGRKIIFRNKLYARYFEERLYARPG